MTGAGECLALIVQAWAARFSDHPAIIGTNAPSLQDMRLSPVGTNFAAIGSSRDAFARAMADRAVQAVDEKGALRKASGQTCGGLLMLEFLLTCQLPTLAFFARC